MTMELYRLENVTKRYGPIHAVDGIHLILSHPCMLAVMGPNGSGKTTLLKLMASVIKPNGGRILFMNQPNIDKRRIGFVSHNTLLYNDLTVLQNLKFFAAMYNVPEAGDRIEEMICQFRIENCRDRTVRELSRGQQQRTSLVRALIHRPDVLIMDEPYTGLDQSNESALDGYLKSLHELGISIIFTSHDVTRARNLAEKVVVLKSGKLTETLITS